MYYPLYPITGINMKYLLPALGLIATAAAHGYVGR